MEAIKIKLPSSALIARCQVKKILRQRATNDCAIAAIASVTGRTYKEVRAAHGRIGRGLTPGDSERLLSRFCKWHKQRRPAGPYIPITEWANKHRDKLAMLTVAYSSGCHALAVIDGVVGGREDGSVLIAYIVDEVYSQDYP